MVMTLYQGFRVKAVPQHLFIALLPVTEGKHPCLKERENLRKGKRTEQKKNKTSADRREGKTEAGEDEVCVFFSRPVKFPGKFPFPILFSTSPAIVTHVEGRPRTCYREHWSC